MTTICLGLLAPLTAASDLPDHPTLSKPFLSKTLTELTRHAGEMVQKEKASLWRMKHLLTRLSGDHTWIPCESAETEHDFALFVDERDSHRGNQLAKTISKEDGDHMSTGTLVSDDGAPAGPLLITEGESSKEGAVDLEAGAKEAVTTDADITMVSTDETAAVESNGVGEASVAEKISEAQKADIPKPTTENASDEDQEASTEGAMDVDAPAQLQENTDNQVQAMETIEGNTEAAEDGQEDLPAPTRMRTRAQAQAASDNATTRTRSATPDSNMDSFIHPYFLAPNKSRPDRDLGLPQHEAEETRRLLQLYIQKQEEVCRGAQRVYDGLLRADRYRHLVMKWAKAEAHVGLNRDMSDGEDWYDKEEWGLDEDLKKGQDEEEEDAATTAKKTRTRRQ